MDLIVNNRLLTKDIFTILSEVASLTNKIQLRSLSGEDNIKIQCPFHNDGQESRPSCFIYIGYEKDIPYGSFSCFTCKSHGSFSKFIGGCFDQDEKWGESWLLDNYGGDYISTNNLNIKDINFEVNNTKVKYIDEKELNKFESYHPYMTQRKLSNEVIKEYQIKYDRKTNSIVFPMRDIDGNLIAFSRRSVDSKKFLIDKDFNKSNIYLLDKMKDEPEVYICESQLNALTLCSYGYKAVATLGAGITDDQIAVLNNTNIKRYILALDPDTAGYKGTRQLCKHLSKSKFVDVVLIPKGKDVNDLTKNEFDSCKIIDRIEFLLYKY